MESIELEEELVCAICRDIFVEPVTLPCGHNYCEECINQLKRFASSASENTGEMRSHYVCPLCFAPCEIKMDLKKNAVLHNIIEKYFKNPASNVHCSVCKGQQRLSAEKSCVNCGESYCTVHIMPHLENPFFRQHVLVSPMADTGKLCKRHGKELELYCKSDSTPLCVYCMLPAEAKHLTGHNIVKLEEAAHMFKEGCQAKLNRISESISEIRDGLLKLEVAATLSKESLAIQQQRYTGFLAKVKMFLDIEAKAWEKRFSVDMVQEARRIKCREEKLKILQRKLLEAEGSLQNAHVIQDPLTLLQLLKNANGSDYYQREFYSSQIKEILEEKTPQPVAVASTGNVPFFQTLQTAFAEEPVWFDPKTAHPQLRMNEDRTSVWATGEKRPLEPDAQRISSCYCVLGDAAFSRGMRYWEVGVAAVPSWALGIAYGSLQDDPPGCELGSNDKSWALSYSHCRQQFCARHDWLAFAFNASVAPSKIGLFLDIDSGILCFYDAELLECLYTFYCSLKAPVYPVFCPKLESDGRFLGQEMKVLHPSAFL